MPIHTDPKQHMNPKWLTNNSCKFVRKHEGTAVLLISNSAYSLSIYAPENSDGVL